MLDKGGALPDPNDCSSLFPRLGNGELTDRGVPGLRGPLSVFVEIPGTAGSDFFLRFKGVIIVSGPPSPFLSSPFSRLGLLPGFGPKPTLSESCRGESSLRLTLLDGPFILGRLNAAAEILFVVAGVEDGELKVDAICDVSGGNTGVTEGEGGVERFRRYSGGVR